MRRFIQVVLILVTMAVAPISVSAQTISTVTGGGPNNIPATTAGIGFPVGVVVDKSGNTYISGGFLPAHGVGTILPESVPMPYIFKVDPSGNLTIYAGNGVSAFSGDNGPATSASVVFPQGMALDGTGNLYFVDSDGFLLCNIRRVDATTHVITSVAGTGYGGCGFSGNNGPATQAQLSFGMSFGSENGLAIDKNGNLYSADSLDNVIRRIDASTQVITTVVGSGTRGFSGNFGPALLADLNQPKTVALDTSGNLFVADTGNCVIRRVDAATQTITTVAGAGTQCGYGGDNSPLGATSALLNLPIALTIDAAGDIFIADSANNVIRRVDGSTQKITTVAGNSGAGFTGDNGPATSAELNIAVYSTFSGHPLAAGGSVALDASGNLLIADSGNARVRVVNSSTQVITTFAGTGFFAFDADNHPATSADLFEPFAVGRDSSGNILIVDTVNERIRKVDAQTGNTTTIAGDGNFAFSGDNGPSSGAEVAFPECITMDNSGNILFCDTFNDRIRMINGTTQEITTIAGNGTGGYTGDNGPATSAELLEPEGLAVDTAGNIFIADWANLVIRRIDHTTGNITTVAGNGTFATGKAGDNGLATSTGLSAPHDVSVDKAGNFFFAEGDLIRRVDAVTGIITTVAGTGLPGLTGDNGPAVNAKLNAPFGVLLDACANIFIADNSNFVIRRVDSLTGIITTVAGNGSGISEFSGDSGPATSAALGSPQRMVFDPAGDLYFADSTDNRIRRVTGLGLMNAASCPTNPVPAITTLQPPGVIAGSGAQTLTVNGSNFVSTSVVNVNGSARATTLVSAAQLTAALLAGDIASVGTPQITVVNPVPGGGTSNAVGLSVSAANNPLPAQTSLQPGTAVAGSAAFALTVNGNNFINGSVVDWNGSARTTTFLSAMQLTAAITAADIQSVGTAAVTIVNPAPGGGTSNALTFTIVDFTVSSPAAPQSVAAGQTGMFAIATAAVGGAFPGNVTFSASGLPTGATATFSPPSVAAGMTTTLMVTTTQRTATQVPHKLFSPRGPLFPSLPATLVLTLLLCGAAFARRTRISMRRFAPVALPALMLIAAGLLTGCLGGFPRVNTTAGTPSGVFTITVTGMSSGISHSTTVTLTVQ